MVSYPVPLGQRRRFGPAPVETAPPQLAQPSPSAFPRAPDQDSPGKRPREEAVTPVDSEFKPTLPEPAFSFKAWFPSPIAQVYLVHCFSVDPNAPRKRRSRWGDTKTELPGLPTAISANGVSQAQLDNYAIQLRLEEINRKLRLNDYVPPEKERYE